jgi:hypothetical protein
MTYHDNTPKRPANDPVRDTLAPPRDPLQRHRTGYGDQGFNTMSWIIGGVALVAAVGIIFWAMSDRGSTVATIDQPTFTVPDNTESAPRTPPARTPDTNTGTTPTPPAQR